jgi:hypothetical protein
MCISATSGSTAPASDPTHHIPYNYEIWVSNGPCSATNPIYVKLAYLCNGSGFSGIVIEVGTGQSDGTIYGNMLNSGTPLNLNTAAGAGAATYECSFCGDADKLSLILWRTLSAAATAFLMIDRAKDSGGNDLDIYFSVLLANSTITKFQNVFKPGAGSVTPISNVIPTVFDGIAGGTAAGFNGQVPVYPLFPTVGYIANPLLGAVVMHLPDIPDGSLLTTVMYGAQHMYLFCKAPGGTAQFNSGQCAFGMRWE